MLSGIVGTCFILSIGILMAHAVDAYRNRLPQIDRRSKPRAHLNT
jgi:hypothetical protein